MDIKSIIQKKRNKSELTKDEIKYFISKYSKDEIAEEQAAALLSYIYINGLTENEIINLAVSMAESGTIIDLSDISPNIVDKHSTGGVGDKVTLILMPVIAALGMPVAKISNRGMGISGGTIDKLESIPGFTSEISIDEFRENIKSIGISLVSQGNELNPVEGKIYKLRNRICCTDSLPIIAASLMSLKIATGSDKVVFDITCGRGTYIKNKDEAKRLANLLIKIGKKLKKDVGCVITSMDEPQGYCIGHNLEMQETIMSLKGTIPEDIEKVVTTLGSLVLYLVNGSKDMAENEKTIKEVIKSGKAFEKFKTMIAKQHGSTEYVDDPELFVKAAHILPVYATEDGTVESIDADLVGSIAIYLGAGRMNSEGDIDRTAGIVLNKKIGQEVKAGETLAFIHTADENKIMGATQNLRDAFKLTSRKIVTKSRILEIVK